MEDAYLATLLSDKKTSLFAIFDDHGGSFLSMQAPMFQPLVAGTSYDNWR